MVAFIHIQPSGKFFNTLSFYTIDTSLLLLILHQGKFRDSGSLSGFTCQRVETYSQQAIRTVEKTNKSLHCIGPRIELERLQILYIESELESSFGTVYLNAKTFANIKPSSATFTFMFNEASLDERFDDIDTLLTL